MRRAVIDLGTNTFNLLIADVEGKDFDIVYKAKMPAKLGENGITNDWINEDAFQRGLNIIQNYLKIAQEHRVEQLNAIATSAVRSAKNGLDFKALIKTETGIDIDIISGEKEADLIYKGVQKSLLFDIPSYLILDIGGGSTEFILVKEGEIKQMQSFNLGIARLLERFQPEDPMSDEQIKAVKDYLRNELKAFFELVKAEGVTTLIGSSGSFDTIISMMIHRFFSTKTFKKKLSNVIEMKHFNTIFDMVISANASERVRIPGMDLLRQEMMPLALIFIQLLIEECAIETIYQSRYALKEGVLFEY